MMMVILRQLLNDKIEIISNIKISQGEHSMSPSKSLIKFYLITALTIPCHSENFDFQSRDVEIHLSSGNMTTKMPFYQDGCFLRESIIKDNDPQKGWILAYLHLGSLSNPLQEGETPYFVLYNKYRGILRLCIFNTHKDSYEFYQVGLKIMNNASTPLFCFTDPIHCFIDDFQTESSLTATSTMNIAGWGVFDYPFVGYDPELISKQAILLANVEGCNVNNFTLNGKGTLDLRQIISDCNPSTNGPGRDPGDLFKDGIKAYGIYKDTKLFVDRINEANTHKKTLTDEEWQKQPGYKDEKSLTEQFWFDTAVSLLGTAAGPWAPVVGGLGSILGSFIGGSHDSVRQPIQFEGKMNFTFSGEISGKTNLTSFSLALNHLNSDGIADEPQTIPNFEWGIFNFKSKPQVTSYHLTIIPWGTGDRMYNIHLVADNLSGSLIINPNSGLQIISKKVAFIFDEFNAIESDFLDLETASSTGYRYRYNTGPDFRPSPGAKEPIPTSILLKLEFSTTSPTIPDSDKNIIVYKKYPISITSHEIIEKDPSHPGSSLDGTVLNRDFGNVLISH